MSLIDAKAYQNLALDCLSYTVFSYTVKLYCITNNISGETFIFLKTKLYRASKFKFSRY